jgi:anaerobic selenocysteine-containing dehydrogenase
LGNMIVFWHHRLGLLSTEGEAIMEERVEVKRAVCLWCKGFCGVLVHVQDGRLLKAEEDPDWPRKVWPPTRGCLRLQAAAEYFYHPDRINFPLKRRGERGESKWQPVSWMQALDEIADRLKQIMAIHGAEAVVWGTGTNPRDDPSQAGRFFRILGTPNFVQQGQICYYPRSAVAMAIVGWFPHYSVRPQTRCVVLLGVEPLIARPIPAHTIMEIKRNGAKLIVIDPRRTRAAAMADIWLQLRHGTDCALLMGMINVIINERLYDTEFVNRWCYGFDKLKERAEGYTPEKVAEITTVPAEQIREAARTYAQNRPGCFVEGMGVEHQQANTEILHARWILAGLTGNIDVQGGDELTRPHPKILYDNELAPQVRLPLDQLEKQISADRFKLFTWPGARTLAENQSKVWGKELETYFLSAHAPLVYRAMLSDKPYPIRAMITQATNPMVTQANTKLVYQALKSLDLHVVMDIFMTPTAELADYVLPVTCWLERPHLHDHNKFAKYMVAGEAALPKAIPNEYEHKDDYDIWRELATRLGNGELMPWSSKEEYWNARLEPTGYTLKEYVDKVRCERKADQFNKYEEVGFATPTGKVELYSTIFERLGYDPLPQFTEPAETVVSNPELAREYPLTLITGGRIREFFHSEWRQVASLRNRRPDPVVQLHPDTAAELGIGDGDWVWIETIRGRVRQKAELFDGINPGVVHAEHGWWFPELPGEEPWLHGVWESNINVVMNDDPDVCNQLNGVWPLKTALCKVYKAKRY